MDRTPPAFYFFDLGQVVAAFDRQIACRQIGALTALSAAEVHAVIYESDLQLAFERGQLSRREFYAAFCERTGTAPDYETLLHAASAMFELQEDVLAIATQLREGGRRLGILSNTCDIHWEYCTTGRFARLADVFRVAALSFELGVMKPQPAIYQAAARLAGEAPAQIFFVDDCAENVAGARHAGFDAVQFTSAAALRRDLRLRGVSLS